MIKPTRELFEEYQNKIKDLVDGISIAELERFFAFLSEIRDANGTLYVAGNGGSAALAEHLTVDFGIGSFARGRSGVKAVSLNSNIAQLTAVANDFSYDEFFELQISNLVTPTDGVLLISCSGNSRNILKLAQKCIDSNIRRFAWMGFDGGRLIQILQEKERIHVKSSSGEYGPVEDIFSILIHISTEFLRRP